MPAKIPVFLIQEKIYFPTNFQQNILKTLDDILEKELGSSKKVLKSILVIVITLKTNLFLVIFFLEK